MAESLLEKNARKEAEAAEAEKTAAVIIGVAKGVLAVGRTLVWLVVTYLVASLVAYPGGVGHLVAQVLLFAAVVALGVWAMRSGRSGLARITPVGDFARLVKNHRIKRIKKAVEALNLGSITEPARIIRIEGEKPTDEALEVWVLIPAGGGQSLESIQRAAHALEPTWAAVDSEVRIIGPGQVAIRWLRVSAEAALLEMEPLTATLEWDGNWDAVPYGLDTQGATAAIKLANNSATVVGGLPGGGKTAGLTTLLSTLVASEAVQFFVFDGKGGSDWGWIQPRAALYNNDDENLPRVAEQLEALEGEMRRRVNMMMEERGGSSIWTTGGPNREMPLMVVVLDEVQTYLDKALVPSGDKEAMVIRNRIEAAVAKLVRKGRSAGVWVVPTTQKPTSDSLPTTIGANAATWVAFSVKTPEAERAIAGSGPAEGQPSATALPAKPGFAVVGTETGAREVVRFGYLPEEIAYRHAAAHAHLAGQFAA